MEENKNIQVESRFTEEQKQLTNIEILLSRIPELNDYALYLKSIRPINREQIETKFDNRLDYESQLKYLKKEYNIVLKRWEHKFNEGIISAYFTPLGELESIANAFSKIQKHLPLSIDQFEDNMIKVKWYEFFKKKRIKSKFIAMLKGELPDDEVLSLVSYLNTDELPAEAIGMFSGDLSKTYTYVIHLYEDKIMLEYLKKKIFDMEKCDDDDNEIFQSPIHLNEKKGNKIDLIRILLAMYDSKLFQKENEERFGQDEFMKEAGKLFNIDLSDYQNDLKMAFNQKIETNVKIFDTMTKHITKRHSEKN